jgi:hypothetical protein
MPFRRFHDDIRRMDVGFIEQLHDSFIIRQIPHPIDRRAVVLLEFDVDLAGLVFVVIIPVTRDLEDVIFATVPGYRSGYGSFERPATSRDAGWNL